MAIKLNTVKCPECGANLSIEEGRTKFFCSYCGAQIIETNENEHIIRSIDEAEIKKSEADIKKTEADLILKMKQMEIDEDRRASNRRERIIILCVIGAAAGIVMYNASDNFDRFVILLLATLCIIKIFDKR